MKKTKKLTGTKTAKTHTTPKKKKSQTANSALTDTTYPGYANGTQYSNVTGVKPHKPPIPFYTGPMMTDTHPGYASGTQDVSMIIVYAENRSLYDTEIKLLMSVFGGDLDYDIIKVWENSPFTFWDASRGLKNTLHIHELEITLYTITSESGNIVAYINEIDEDTLVHEAAHAWQYQHHGPSYMTSALKQHFHNLVDNSYDPYKYADNIKNKIPWDLWKPEQQAKWIEKNRKLPGIDLLKP